MAELDKNPFTIRLWSLICRCWGVKLPGAAESDGVAGASWSLPVPWALASPSAVPTSALQRVGPLPTQAPGGTKCRLSEAGEVAAQGLGCGFSQHRRGSSGLKAHETVDCLTVAGLGNPSLQTVQLPPKSPWAFLGSPSCPGAPHYSCPAVLQWGELPPGPRSQPLEGPVGAASPLPWESDKQTSPRLVATCPSSHPGPSLSSGFSTHTLRPLLNPFHSELLLSMATDLPAVRDSMGCCQSCWGSSGLGGCPRAERSPFSVQQAGKHPRDGAGPPSACALSFSPLPAEPPVGLF